VHAGRLVAEPTEGIDLARILRAV